MSDESTTVVDPNAVQLEVLTWFEFQRAIDQLAYEIMKKFRGELTDVWGAPRGGLPLAVALSHKLHMPLAERRRESTLWVDDIYDTGATFRGTTVHPPLYSAVWLAREDKELPEGMIHVKRLPRNRWAVFPWESIAYAVDDLKAYEKKRRGRHP